VYWEVQILWDVSLCRLASTLRRFELLTQRLSLTSQTTLVHYRAHKSLRIVPILSRTNAVNARPSYCFKKHFNIIKSAFRSSKWLDHSYLLTLLLTLLLTPCSTVLLQKLTGSQLVKKFRAFYGTWRFSTAFTRICHLSLSWARSVPSRPHPTSWRPILILSFHLRLCLSSGLFP